MEQHASHSPFPLLVLGCSLFSTIKKCLSTAQIYTHLALNTRSLSSDTTTQAFVCCAHLCPCYRAVGFCYTLQFTRRPFFETSQTEDGVDVEVTHSPPHPLVQPLSLTLADFSFFFLFCFLFFPFLLVSSAFIQPQREDRRAPALFVRLSLLAGCA